MAHPTLVASIISAPVILRDELRLSKAVLQQRILDAKKLQETVFGQAANIAYRGMLKFFSHLEDS